ncbi:hypothetical protein L6452_10089 [Arctium lappa]|uniref:Uncharacterized protein n=1 Tax=Arctium lappa TaxID=4217 RepID=A0ACB9DMY9_ARCLA|nr:hypothetical protein L6452_10089 [Arctium lappa]
MRSSTAEDLRYLRLLKMLRRLSSIRFERCTPYLSSSADLRIHRTFEVIFKSSDDPTGRDDEKQSSWNSLLGEGPREVVQTISKLEEVGMFFYRIKIEEEESSFMGLTENEDEEESREESEDDEEGGSTTPSGWSKKWKNSDKEWGWRRHGSKGLMRRKYK